MIILKKLTIKNFAVVSEVEMQLKPGLSVLTGETGAGKSLLVGAINLLLGERASSEFVRSGEKRATIEAELTGDFSRISEILAVEGIECGESVLLTREISADGRSRCLVNDQRVGVALLKQIGERICDLHGQHQHQWLLDPSRHLEFLDRYGNLTSLADSYGKQYEKYKDIKLKIAEISTAIAADKEKRELYSYQLAEIEAATLSFGEEDALENEQKELQSVTTIKERLQTVKSLLDEESGATERTAEARRQLQSVSTDFAGAQAMLKELDSVEIGLIEVCRTLEEHGSRLVEDPARLEQVGERLAEIYKLKRKYGGSLQSVLDYRDEIAAFLEAGESSSELLCQLESELAEVSSSLLELGLKLQKKRETAAAQLSQALRKQLKLLGMPQADFTLRFDEPMTGELIVHEDQQYRLTARGMKLGYFLFSANPGEDLRPLAKIASGGEISRVMLAMKSLIAGKDQVDLLVFDEIDAGIGGETALLVGRLLKQLARKQQVIAITHLQQIASHAESHFLVTKRVSKGRTESALQLLEKNQRVAELARMISGGELGEVERRQAEKLLADASGTSYSRSD